MWVCEVSTASPRSSLADLHVEIIEVDYESPDGEQKLSQADSRRAQTCAEFRNFAEPGPGGEGGKESKGRSSTHDRDTRGKHGSKARAS
jgi:hypothetical protein